ncbi:MAG: ABC transporter substrate-binding protein [Streptosporangiaceae bacterium]
MTGRKRAGDQDAPGGRRPSRGRRARMVTIAGCGAAAIALVAGACGSSGSSSSSGGTKEQGGVATYALPPSTTPNYIFPMTSSTYISVANTAYLQYFLYRPLYWFGNGTQPTLNTSLSLADQPVYSGKQVTITLKNYKWSNGTAVSAQNIVFWIHMLQAVGSTEWGAFVPGGFPTNVTDVKATSATTLTMTMNKAYSPTWFTYNELSQIVPMPKAWDRTASGPSDCTDTVSDCKAVFTYLDSQSKSMSSWASSPLWSVVNGPFKLASFNPDGNATFVPNKSYSGPVKPTLSEFKEIPFTTEASEYNVLRSGSGGQKLDVGYIPTTDAPKKPANATVGANPVPGYTLDPLYSWSINYFVSNENSTTPEGKVLKQLYFRQALQYLVNQASVIAGPLHGYGFPTVGPVGSYPSTQFLSTKGKQGDPFPYNPGKAKQLLSSHGWKVVPNGTTTCTNPSLCGAGVKQGQGLSFTLPYATGTDWIQSEMTQLKSNASSLGIQLSLQPKPFNQVTAIAGGNCAAVGSSCAWDFGNWGGGWTFAPDYYPSGETLFQSGSAANSAGYTSKQDDNLIAQTLTSSSLASLYTWQDYLATQLPEDWQPNGVYELTEVASNLHGVIPQPTTLYINPENWYFTK